MADLSAYINFSVVLDKSTLKMQVVDNSAYPAGVAQTVTGVLSITQPDLITLTGSFSSPDIYWTGSSLHAALKDLRLATNNSFQNGAYVITYTVRATGYTDTVLTKTFSLNYTAPSLVLTQNFDVFTPNLSVQDATIYSATGFTYLTTSRSWSADIDSVLGTVRTVTSSTQNFDLAYLGNYYDSKYSVSLVVKPIWQLTAVNPFVTIVDQLSISSVYYAEIPPTLATLLTGLDTLKSQLDASICNCATYSVLKTRYLLAESIYDHMIKRGTSGDLAGLSLYVYQLQKLFNNNVTPSYTNTNTVIPTYDWGSGAVTTISWNSITGKPSTVIIEWIVGQGGFPGDGASVLTDARLVNSYVRVFRQGVKQISSDPGDGSSYYIKILADNFVTFIQPLTTGEIISVEIISASAVSTDGGGVAVAQQDKGAVSGLVDFDLVAFSDFKLSISNNITVTLSNPSTPCYVLIEVTHTVAGKTITNLPGTLASGFAWASGTGDVTILIGRYSGTGWFWKSSVYTITPPFVVNDDFVGTAATNLTGHTPPVGGAITKIYSTTGNVILVGDGTTKPSTPDSTVGTYKYANQFSGANQKITVIFKKAGIIGSAHLEVLGLFVRADSSQSDSTGYTAQFLDDGTNLSLTLYKVVNGTSTALNSSTNRNDLHDGLSHDISIEITGSTITIKVDGVLFGSYTDSALTAGRDVIIKNYCESSVSANSFRLDNVKAENI